MDTPIYQALNHIIHKDNSRFHMPGHKGKDLFGVFGKELLQYDITEVQGADSLYAANDAILHCEQRLAVYYGANRSLISCQGSTLCIQTMLSLVRGRGRTLIAARNAHVSAVNAMALLDYDPLWVYPAYNAKTGVGEAVTAAQIEAVLESAKDVAAVYITSPNYYGVLSDITAIAEICGRYSVPLLVDNAHGAHLKAAGYSHPITQGASMCCDGAHKTLPVITGGAYLHIADEEYIDGAKDAMAVFGSTSPSYLIMLSIDLCTGYLAEDAANEFLTLRNRIGMLEEAAIKKGFTKISGVRDETRLPLCAYDLGYSGAQLAQHLAQYLIEPEYIGENTVVLLPSPNNSNRDFERLARAIEGIEPRENPPELVPAPVVAKQKFSPREAFFAKKYMVPMQLAVGRVAAVSKSTCPPGVPIIMCGEVLSPEAVKQLVSYGCDNISVVAIP